MESRRDPRVKRGQGIPRLQGDLKEMYKNFASEDGKSDCFKKVGRAIKQAEGDRRNVLRRSVIKNFKKCKQEVRADERKTEVRDKKAALRKQYDDAPANQKQKVGADLCRKAMRRLPPATNFFCQKAFGEGGSKVKVTPENSIKMGPHRYRLMQVKDHRDSTKKYWTWYRAGEEFKRMPDGRMMKKLKGYKPKFTYIPKQNRFGETIRKRSGENAIIPVTLRGENVTNIGQVNPSAKYQSRRPGAKNTDKRYRIVNYEKKTRGPNTSTEIWGKALKEARGKQSIGQLGDIKSELFLTLYDPAKGYLPPQRVKLSDAVKLFYQLRKDREEFKKDLKRRRETDKRYMPKITLRDYRTAIASLKLDGILKTLQGEAWAKKYIEDTGSKASGKNSLPPIYEKVRRKLQKLMKHASITDAKKDKLRSLIKQVDKFWVLRDDRVDRLARERGWEYIHDLVMKQLISKDRVIISAAKIDKIIKLINDRLVSPRPRRVRRGAAGAGAEGGEEGEEEEEEEEEPEVDDEGRRLYDGVAWKDMSYRQKQLYCRSIGKILKKNKSGCKDDPKKKK